MWTPEEEKIAEDAAQNLGKLQGQKGPTVLEEPKIIRDKVQNTRTDEHERAEA